MIDDWEKVREYSYQSGFRRMLKRRFLLPTGELRDYDIMDDGHTVCALAVTPEQSAILTREYRPGPEEVLIELPGGFIDDGETARQAIERELLEETGYRGTIETVGTVLQSAYSTMTKTVFLVRDCRRVQDPHPEEARLVETVTLSLGDFRRHVLSGRMTDVDAGLLILRQSKIL